MRGLGFSVFRQNNFVEKCEQGATAVSLEFRLFQGDSNVHNSFYVVSFHETKKESEFVTNHSEAKRVRNLVSNRFMK